MAFGAENILYYMVAAASGYAGALTAFYRLRSKTELLSTLLSNIRMELSASGKQILDIEKEIGDRITFLEKGAVLIHKCADCKAGWSTQIEVYHKESMKDAIQIRELAALEMTNIKQRLEFMNQGQEELKKATNKMSEILTAILTTLASMGHKQPKGALGEL